MAQRAILELPIIEFERHVDSMEKLSALCARQYGLVGLAPQSDSILHFAASLWRFREQEDLWVVAALSHAWLLALSQRIGAERRLERLQIDEAANRDLREAEAELQECITDHAQLSRLISELVQSALTLAHDEPDRARRYRGASLDAMADPAWLGQLEVFARELSSMPLPHLDWDGPLRRVCSGLAQTRPAAEGNGRKPGRLDDSLVTKLQHELEDYRRIATQASDRLRMVDTERRLLENELHQSESRSSQRERSLEEARRALENTLGEARARIASWESGRHARLQDAESELQRLRRENARLERELLAAVTASADIEGTREALLERLERSSDEQHEAADVLSALSSRLETVQLSAVSTAEEADVMRSRLRELEDTVGELREEISRATEHAAQADATVAALENATGRSAEYETLLTEAEVRIAQAEETIEALEEAAHRAEGLADELKDREYQHTKLEEKFRAQKESLNTVSGQLAEAESLAGDLQGRVTQLERENERLRRDLSDAQSRMLDARGDADEVRESLKAREAEAAIVTEQLKEERAKSRRIGSESVHHREKLASLENDLALARAEKDALTERMRGMEELSSTSHSEALARAGELDLSRKQAADLRSKLQAAEAELQRMLAEFEARRTQQDSQHRTAESQLIELQRAAAERDAARDAEARLRPRLGELESAVVAAEQALSQQREESRAQADLESDRRAKLEERVALLQQRLESAAAEKTELANLLQQAEAARNARVHELETLVEGIRGKEGGHSREAESARAEAKSLQEKLNETESFLIKRQRDFERAESQFKSLLEEVGKVADLRGEYEKADDDEARQEIASQIGRRLDSLFAASGRRVHADRRTEKVVILHVKKSESEIADQADKPFIATNKPVVSKGAKGTRKKSDPAQ